MSRCCLTSTSSLKLVDDRDQRVLEAELHLLVLAPFLPPPISSF